MESSGLTLLLPQGFWGNALRDAELVMRCRRCDGLTYAAAAVVLGRAAAMLWADVAEVRLTDLCMCDMAGVHVVDDQLDGLPEGGHEAVHQQDEEQHAQHDAFVVGLELVRKPEGLMFPGSQPYLGPLSRLPLPCSVA